MSDRLDIRLLDRFLTGAASKEEMAVVRRWLAAHPEQVLAETRFGLAADEASWDVDAAWVRLQARLAGSPEPSATGQTGQELRPLAVVGGDAAPAGRTPPAPAEGTLRLVPRAARRPVRTWLGAGALLAAAVATLVVWRAGLLPSVARPAASAPLAEVVTGAGRRATLRLPDGTTVRLDAGSRLRYPSRMPAGAGRELALEGQAYFDVTHDATRPFTVRAGGTLIRDIGTEFGVTAYPGSPVSVVVARGSVALGRRGERTLQPGELGRIDSAGNVAVRHVDVRSYTAWTQGVLSFDARPLREVVPELSRWYGVQIRVADAGLAARPLTAEFRDDLLPQVLDAMAMALDARWQRNGDTVVFMAGN